MDGAFTAQMGQLWQSELLFFRRYAQKHWSAIHLRNLVELAHTDCIINFVRALVLLGN